MVVVSQAIATAVLGVIVLAVGGWSEAGPRLWFAVAAGLVGPIGVLTFYKALALGPMGVVSPLATLSVAVPIGVGLVLGERPGPLQVAGVAVAVTGVFLAAGPQRGDTSVQRRAILLTLVAALGFGSVFALLTEASTSITGLFLALFVQRLLSTVVGGAALAASVRRGAAAPPQAGPIPASLPGLAFVGIADVAANGTYAVAAQHGPVTVAAVLASLYPVVTALAARGFLSERLRAVQAAGASLALVGTLLLATG